MTDRDATRQLEGKSVSYRNELLFTDGINFNALPSWQKRGVGMYWVSEERAGENPVTRQAVVSIRRRLHTEYELPFGEEYARFTGQRVTDATAVRSESESR